MTTFLAYIANITLHESSVQILIDNIMYIAIVLKTLVCASDSRLCPVYVVFAIHAVSPQETQ